MHTVAVPIIGFIVHRATENFLTMSSGFGDDGHIVRVDKSHLIDEVAELRWQIEEAKRRGFLRLGIFPGLLLG